MSIKSKLYDLFVWVKQKLPNGTQELFADFFFLYFPMKLIKIFTVEYEGYLEHYPPQPGEVVIDAGAWKGHFTLIASRLVGKNGLVVAIEPQADMCEKLKERIDRLRIKNVIVVNYGLLNEDTSQELAKRNSSAFSVNLSNNVKEGSNLLLDTQSNTELVEIRKLDTLLDELKIKTINFIKMDIEGAELKALIGAKNMLVSTNPRLAIASYHILNGEKTCFEVENILRNFGYEAVTEYPAHLTTYGWKKVPDIY